VPIWGTNLGTVRIPLTLNDLEGYEDSDGVAKIRSVSPNYARLRNARRIIGPRARHVRATDGRRNKSIGNEMGIG
jgi:hypothetical protein